MNQNSKKEFHQCVLFYQFGTIQVTLLLTLNLSSPPLSLLGYASSFLQDPSSMLQAQFFDTYFESDSETGPHYVALTVLELICTSLTAN